MLWAASASAQNPSAQAANATLEGVSIGESMSQVRVELGDPVQVRSIGDQQIWRYLERGAAVYVDVIPKGNVVSSVTVIRRFPSVSYTDDRGMSFGMSSGDVRVKVGTPTRESTNSDDGSVDLWYVTGDTARIYEFYGDKLGFVQILARPGSQPALGANEKPILPADGSSIASAIRIRPSNFLGNSSWIDAYLAMNQCGGNGHWNESSLNLQEDTAVNDPLAYTVVHAKCTAGGSERTFYFDTHGAVTKTGPSGKDNTIYIDVRQLQTPRSPSPAPSSTPR